MKEEQHTNDEQGRGSNEPPQKRRREDSEPQLPTPTGRPLPNPTGRLGFRGPPWVVRQNQAMIAAHNGPLTNDNPPISHDHLDALRAENYVLSKNVERLKDQVRQQLEEADDQAGRIDVLEARAETLALKLRRAELEKETLQAKFDAHMNTHNMVQKMAYDKQVEISGLRNSLQATTAQMNKGQQDLAALQQKYDYTVASNRAKIAELDASNKRQTTYLQDARRKLQQMGYEKEALRKEEAQRQQTPRQQTPRQQTPRQEEAQNQELETHNHEVDAQNQETESQSKESTPQ